MTIERRGHLWALKFWTPQPFGVIWSGFTLARLPRTVDGQEEAVRTRAEQYGARTTDCHAPVARRRRDGLTKEKKQKES